jgi:phosphopantothenoylcysteine decarboxylase/phosphopantothenate--cysteine ligase
MALRLERNPDIVTTLAARKGRRLVVGFAAETHDVVSEAKRKLAAKHLDLIVANDVTAEGAGFGTDTNIVRLLDARGLDASLEKMTKDDVADRILDWVIARRAQAPRAALRRVR